MAYRSWIPNNKTKMFPFDLVSLSVGSKSGDSGVAFSCHNAVNNNNSKLWASPPPERFTRLDAAWSSALLSWTAFWTETYFDAITWLILEGTKRRNCSILWNTRGNGCGCKAGCWRVRGGNIDTFSHAKYYKRTYIFIYMYMTVCSNGAEKGAESAKHLLLKHSIILYPPLFSSLFFI